MGVLLRTTRVLRVRNFLEGTKAWALTMSFVGHAIACVHEGLLLFPNFPLEASFFGYFLPPLESLPGLPVRPSLAPASFSFMMRCMP